MRLSRGFTIIELTIALAVVAIALSFAVPSMNQARQVNEVKRVQSALFNDLNAARVDAITRGAAVTLCASSNGIHCDGVWNRWMVFEGGLPAGTTAVADLLRAGQLAEVDVLASAASLTFSSIGSVDTPFLATLCSTDASPRAVQVSVLGRAATSLDYDGDGLHDSPQDGGTLVCE